MSADNGIYIHKFRSGWKVAHCQAIENIYWHRGNKKYNYRILNEYFKNSKVYETREKAFKEAQILTDTLYDYTEYGVCEV